MSPASVSLRMIRGLVWTLLYLSGPGTCAKLHLDTSPIVHAPRWWGAKSHFSKLQPYGHFLILNTVKLLFWNGSPIWKEKMFIWLSIYRPIHIDRTFMMKPNLPYLNSRPNLHFKINLYSSSKSIHPIDTNFNHLVLFYCNNISMFM